MRKNFKNINPKDEIPQDVLKYFSKKHTKNKDNIRLKIINIGIFVIALIISIRLISLIGANIDFPLFEIFSSNKSDYKRENKKLIRRDIIDRNGIKIASSIPSFNLYANAKDILFPDKTAKSLTKLFPDLNYNDLMKKFKSKKSFVYIKRQIPIKYKDSILRMGDPGLKFENTYERIYPLEELFVHIVGVVDIDNNGLSGLEKGLNKEILKETAEPVQLTLDSRIQTVLRNVLMEGIEKYDANQAAAVIMNIKTGEILGLVSLPDYKPEDVGIALTDSKYNNHITSDVYEQGSVFKVFTSALAIENGFADIDPIPTYDISKPLKIGDFTIREELIHQKTVKFSDILVLSSNIASAIVAMDLGGKKQREFLKKLNMFDKVSSLPIPELGTPVIPSEGDWTKATTATAGYGYSLSVTPLHTLLGFIAIVNNGIYVQPKILKDIKNEEHDILDKILPNTEHDENDKHSERIVSLSTSKLMRKWLRETVTKGKAYKDPGGLITGGKSGTSTKIINGKYSQDLLRTFYISTWPIDNPQYAMLVMMDEAKKGPWGSNCRLSGCNVFPMTKEILKNIAVYTILY